MKKALSLMKRLIAVILATLLLSVNVFAEDIYPMRIGDYVKLIDSRTAVILPAYDDNFVYADRDGNELDSPVAVSQAMDYINQRLANIKSKYGITVKQDWAVSDGESAWTFISRERMLERWFESIKALPYAGAFCAKAGKSITYSDTAADRERYNLTFTAWTDDKGKYSLITTCGSAKQFAHEVGHAVANAGGKSLRSQWVSLNTIDYVGYDYTQEQLFSGFITDYAAKNFDEDFAETFAVLTRGSINLPESADVSDVALAKANLLRGYLINTAGFPADTVDGLEYCGNRDIPDWAVDAFATYPKFAHIGLEDMRLPATRLDFAYALDDKLCRLPQYKRYDLRSLETDVEGLGELVPFLDIPIYRAGNNVNDYDGLLIYSLMQAGIVSGTSDTTFSPDATVTRQEAAAMLYRALKHLGYSKPVSSDNFSDMADVADWAKEAVNAMSDTGIMNGVGGERFDPNGLYTYNQVAVTVYRLYNYATANLGAGY